MKSKFTLAILLIISANQLWAGTTTTNTQAKAVLSSACTFSVTDVDFGAFNPITSPTLRLAGTLTSRCSNGAVANAFPPEQSAFMTGKVFKGLVRYHLYKNPTGSNLSDWWAPDYKMQVYGTGSTVTQNYYVELRQNQMWEFIPDDYSKSITVTLNF